MKALEEDDYFKTVEEIVKRDFFPDLLKMEKLQEYEALKQKQLNGEISSVDVPSELIKSTGKSRLTVARDNVDTIIALKKAQLDLDPVSNDAKKKRKVGLDEYMHRFTSEDNASF